MTLRTVDLFAGCGGLSLGFQKEKYNIVAAFELWDAAVKCYKENFSHTPIFLLVVYKWNLWVKQLI